MKNELLAFIKTEPYFYIDELIHLNEEDVTEDTLFIDRNILLKKSDESIQERIESCSLKYSELDLENLVSTIEYIRVDPILDFINK